MGICADCGSKLGGFNKVGKEFPEGFVLCHKCSSDQEIVSRHAELNSARTSPAITLTTETFLGDLVTERLGVIAAECVLGVNVLRDLKSAFTNITGGRSVGLQNSLKEAKDIVFQELKIEAHKLGANAVIGIDLDYQELNGKGGDMLMLVASGTAVILHEGQAS